MNKEIANRTSNKYQYLLGLNTFVHLGGEYKITMIDANFVTDSQTEYDVFITLKKEEAVNTGQNRLETLSTLKAHFVIRGSISIELVNDTLILSTPTRYNFNEVSFIDSDLQIHHFKRIAPIPPPKPGLKREVYSFDKDVKHRLLTEKGKLRAIILVDGVKHESNVLNFTKFEHPINN